MKKVFAILSCVALFIGFTAVPANADVTQLTCDYASPSVNRINGAYIQTVSKTPPDPDRFDTILDLNDGAGRRWHWQIFHEGSLSAEGYADGSFRVIRSMLNLLGTDNMKAVVDSTNGNVHCWGSAPWNG